MKSFHSSLSNPTEKNHFFEYMKQWFSRQEQKTATASLAESINTQYMRTFTLVLLIAVCFYVAVFKQEQAWQEAIAMLPESAPERNELPIYSVETQESVIALTFDAAWGVEDLNDILTTLSNHQAKATFFVSGDWVDKYPDAVMVIYEAGHELGNHGTNHKHMPNLSEEEMISEIMTCHNRVEALTGYSMTAFRAPYSDWNDSVVATASSCGYASINQNVDSVDWKDYGVDSIIQTVMKDPDLDNGAIILLHNGSTYTSAALDQLLCELEEAGYSFVTISDLVYQPPYTLDHTGRQFPVAEPALP